MAGAPRPIFVIGCVRSGTTLLRAMLTAHPNIAIPYEAHSFSRIISTPKPWTHRWGRDDVASPVDEFLSHPAVRFWKLDRSAVLQELGRGPASFRYRDVLQAVYGAYAKREGKRRWGDKTPGNAYDMANIARAFPEAQFVHITRDGRDVYLSLLALIQRETSWAAPWRDVRTAARKWSWREQCVSEAGGRVSASRYHHLRYEDLLQQPQSSLQAICLFLGEPFAPEMLGYHTMAGLVPPQGEQGQHHLLSQPPDVSRAYRWKREMPMEDVRAFEHIAGATLVSNGYEVHPGMRRRAASQLAVMGLKRKLKILAGIRGRAGADADR